MPIWKKSCQKVIRKLNEKFKIINKYKEITRTQKAEIIKFIDYQEKFDCIGVNRLNCQLTGTNDKSVILSSETRDNISKAQMGRVHSQETRDNICKAQIGRVFTKETRDKLSMARKGKTPFKGKANTQETRENMSKAHRGNKANPSQIGLTM